MSELRTLGALVGLWMAFTMWRIHRLERDKLSTNALVAALEKAVNGMKVGKP